MNMDTISSNATKTLSKNCSNNSILSNKSNDSKNNNPLNKKNAMKLLSQLNKYRRRRYSVEKLISDESDRVAKMEARLQKLKNIDLYEKNSTQNLYEWPMLFNCNTKLNFYYNKNLYKRKKEDVETEKNTINSPVILMDLPEDSLKKFFIYINSGKNNLATKRNASQKIFKVLNSMPTESSNANKYTISNFNISSNNNSKSNYFKDNVQRSIIRPVSIYSVRKPQQTFYFSNEFNDYYKEDFKTFASKIPALKAKVKNKKQFLINEIKKQKFKSEKKERKLYCVTRRNNLIISKDVLIIAGERKNADPLLKQIYDQINPNNQKIKKAIKYYYKTDKPFGSPKGRIDYTVNDRWNSSNEISKLRKNSEKKPKNLFSSKSYRKFGEKIVFPQNNGKLILSYYDDNDPHIKIFNDIIKENKDKIVESIPNIIERYKKYKLEKNNEDSLNKMTSNLKNETRKRKKKVSIKMNGGYFLTQTNVNI